MNTMQLRRTFIDAACAARAKLIATHHDLRPGSVILIVEHRDEVFATLMPFVANEGYCVERAVNADEATRKLRQALPDLVLVNCEQPDESGWLLVSKWRLAKMLRRVWLYQAWQAISDQNWIELTKIERILYYEDDVLSLADQLRDQLTLERRLMG